MRAHCLQHLSVQRVPDSLLKLLTTGCVYLWSVWLALYELSLFDAADAVALDRDYDVQQYQALLATVAAQRTVNKRPATSGAVKEVEEKTNDEQRSPAAVTNVCTFDLKYCGPPRSS